MNKVITRFPPSPTGLFHIGSARTALFNYLYAKHNDGEMILRFEDTDKERSKEEYEQDILEGLNWLGIEYSNEEPFKQSERTDVYKKYLEQLIDSEKAYVSEEKEGDRKEVIRFKNPGGEVSFTDAVRGEVTFDVSELGDFVIAKSLDEPLYHLAVVIDDHEMNVTDVIRGEDHISNTPRQILLIEALGFERPKYAHIPLILAPDKSKLSKRHGAVSVNEFKDYEPEALVNYLALLGWNPGDDREIFSMDELVKEFSLEKVHKSGAVFDQKKLDWINKHYLKEEDIKKKLSEHFSGGLLEKLVPVMKERINKISDINFADLEYFQSRPSYDKNLLYWKDNKDKDLYIKHLEKVKELIGSLGGEFNPEDVKNLLWEYASSEGRGEVLWPLRVSLSGREKSPDPFELIYLLGTDQSIERIEKAISILNE